MLADTGRAVLLALRLGLRRAGRDVRLDVVLALGVALTTVVALATAASIGVVDHRDERRAALTPSLRFADDLPDTSLLMMDPSIVPQRRWNGVPVVRTYVSGRGQVPGVAQLPAPGQYVASPALQDAIADDAVVRALFAGRELVGTISPTGLVDPGEARAVIGVRPDAPLLAEVLGFGEGPPGQSAATDDRATLDGVVTLLALTLVWLPALALLVVVTRLGGRTHQARARALRLMGLTRWQVRVVEMAGVLLVIVPAALAGTAVAALLASHQRVPGTDIAFFADDAALPWAARAGVAAAVVVAVAVIAALGVAMSPEAPPSRVPRLSRRATPVGLTLLVAGLATLLGIPVLRELVGPVANYLLWLGCAAVAVGLALSGPGLVARIATSRAPRATSASTLVGLRMTAAGSSTPLRLGSLLCVLVIVLLGGRSFLNILNGGSTTAWLEAAHAARGLPVTVTDLGGQLTLPTVRAAVPRAPVVQVRSTRTSDGRPVLVATGSCDDLRRLSGEPATACDAQPRWLRVGRGTGPAPHPTGTVRVGDTDVAPSDGPAIAATNLPPDLDGALFVPSSTGEGTSQDGSTFFVVVDGRSVGTSMARLSAADPTAQLDLGEADRGNPDAQQFPAQAEWITVATVGGLALGVLAVLAGTLGDARDRRGRYRGLERLGASRRQVAAVHVWVTGVPLLSLGLVACAVGAVVCQALHAVDDRATFPGTTVAQAAVAVVLAAAGVAAASISPRGRP